MEIFFIWIVLSFLIGVMGSDRKIGFFGSFFLSIIFSPLIGVIFALTSEKKSSLEYKKSLLKFQEETLRQSKKQEPKYRSVIEELEKLTSFREKKLITEEEYQKLKVDLFQNRGKLPRNDTSSYYFIYGIEDFNISFETEKNLEWNSEDLLNRIQQGEKFIKFYDCNEYPFYAALILDKRKVEIPNQHIKQLEFLAKKYFQCDSINDTLQKIKENNSY